VDRLLNYIFLLSLVYIFALWAPANIHSVILIGVIISFLFCAMAFAFRWLSLDGAAAGMVIGIITFGLGGWPTILALLAFFLSSALISRSSEGGSDNERRRSGLQVWANGFWVAFWLLAGLLTNMFVCWMAASAAIATATADTWATELGSLRFKTTTYLSDTLEEVPAGSQGGISWPGLAASLGGSIMIAAIAYLGFSFHLAWLPSIIAAGFAGSLFDSYLGATVQGTTKSIAVFGTNRSKNVTVDNNMVNWMATGFGSMLILIFNMLIT
jgi:uncharacterized protein (TIGR00297 family)